MSGSNDKFSNTLFQSSLILPSFAYIFNGLLISYSIHLGFEFFYFSFFFSAIDLHLKCQKLRLLICTWIFKHLVWGEMKFIFISRESLFSKWWKRLLFSHFLSCFIYLSIEIYSGGKLISYHIQYTRVSTTTKTRKNKFSFLLSITIKCESMDQWKWTGKEIMFVIELLCRQFIVSSKWNECLSISTTFHLANM